MSQIDHFIVIPASKEPYGTGTGMILLTIISGLNIAVQFMVSVNNNEGIVIMEVFTFIVLIVLITQFFEYRKSMAKLNAKVGEVNDSQMQKELENVKQRLIVLERIVTDKNYDLNEEFGKIRGE